MHNLAQNGGKNLPILKTGTTHVGCGAGGTPV